MNSNTQRSYSPYAAINWIADSPLKSGQKAVLLALSRFMSKRNGYRVWPSQKLLCEKAGMGETALRKTLTELVELQYIEIESVPCRNGPGRYVYTLNVTSECEGTYPRNVRVEPSESEHKGEVQKELDTEKKVEALSERQTPAAVATGKNLSAEERTEEAEILAQKYAGACKDSPKARVAFWNQCGRIHFPESPKFKPDHKLSFGQLDSLNEMFRLMPTKACFVIAFAMQTWSKAHRKTKYVTPTVSALEEYGPERLYHEWHDYTQQKAQKASLARVSRNLQGAAA